MKLIRKLMCACGWHNAGPAIDPHYSVYFYCESCGDFVEGDIAKALRRRRR